MLENRREHLDSLHRFLKAWAAIYNSNREILSELGASSHFGKIYKNNNKESFVRYEPDLNGYEYDDIAWINSVIESFDSVDKRIINLEYCAQNSEIYKNRIEIWRGEFNLAASSYRRRLMDVKDNLLIAVLLRDKFAKQFDETG